MPKTFQKRHVVVTGSTGELGGVVAGLFLKQGAVCHLPVRSAEKLRPALRRAHVVEAVDLVDERSVASFYRDLSELWASVHCVGAFSAAPIGAASAQELETMLAVNARTAFLCSREAARRMRAARAKNGRIVNVIARQALEPRRGAGMVPYAMSKAAVAALTVALAAELSDEGILVNAVAPSLLDTPENRAAMPGADFTRWVALDELAAAILELCSPEYAGSGNLVPVYGGM